MKKKVTILSIIGLVLFAGGIVMQFFLPQMTNGVFAFDTKLMFDWPTIQSALGNGFNFTAIGAYQIVFVAVVAVVGLLLLIHLILLIVKKHPLALLESLAWTIGSAALLFTVAVLWTPVMFTSGTPLTDLKSTPDYLNAPFFIYLIAVFNGTSDSLRVLYLILGFVPAALVLIGFILCLAGLIVDFRYLGSLSRESKKERKELDASGLDSVVVVHEDESPAGGDAAEDLGKEAADAKRKGYNPAAAENEYNGVRPSAGGQGGVGQSSINGPFLIQYINTYAPEPRQEPAPKPVEQAAPAPAVPAAEPEKKPEPLSADDIRKIIKEEMNAEKKPERPLIIAVPSPAKKKEPEPVPEQKKYITSDDIREIVASELKNALGANDDVVVEPVPQQPLTADEIREIIVSELKAAKEEKEEPKPAPVEEKKLSEEDVRDVIRQELLAFRDAEDAKEKQRREDEERKAAEEAARAAEIEKAKKEAVAKALNEKEAKENEPQALSAEDIRRIIAEEFAKQTPAEEPKKPSVEPQAPETFDPEEIRAMLREEIRAAQPVVEEKVPPVTVVVKQADPEPEPEKEEPEEPTLSAEEVRSIVRETLLAKEEEAAEPEPEPAEPQLTADDVRQIIAEAFAAQAKEEPAEPEPEPEPAEPQLTADDVRSIIAEALANFNPQPAPQPQPTTIVVNPAPVVVQNEPAPEEPAVEQPLEAPAEDANKIIRIPFPTRMVEAEDEMRANYNELKSEILAYGVKSRVSNSGDTFRLHKVTFVKITIAGKSLKLYFALDPKDYENTSLPIQDASHKNIYKDIPLVFKVKSELSMRRAKQLISDVMEKHGLEQGRVELRDHADSLKDYVAAGTKEVEDDEE